MYHLRKGISHTSQPAWGISLLTYNKNKSGPNINTWETPQLKFTRSKNFLSIMTLKVLLDKYYLNHEITFSENPVHPIFLRSIS